VVQLQPARRAEDLAGAGNGEEDAHVIPVHTDLGRLGLCDK
jgi:hypothetical protein